MVVDFRQVARILSPAILSLGILAVIPAIYAFVTDTTGVIQFSAAFCVSIIVSALLNWLGRNASDRTSLRELFLFTGLLWFLMTAIAAIPFYFLLEDIDFAAALFESASGLSTTGATVISDLKSRPPAILLWRSILQFLGGIGFVVIAVAILPSMAMGGMNLFKTESTSFDGSAKLTPHIKTMALALLSWYFGTLLLCTFFYSLGGYDLFLAVNAALCTVSTGGMMPIDASMNGSPPFIHYTAIVFMFTGSLPFLLLLRAAKDSITVLLRDQQVLGFCIITLVLTLSVMLSLILANGYDTERAFRTAAFNVISILSSSGFNLEDFTAWNRFASIVFLIILACGGCSGSTAGGIKLFRLQICFSMFQTQIKKSIHPHLIAEPRFNHRIIDSDTLRSVITYLVAYMLLAIISALTATMLGLDLTDSITGTLSALSNIGPAIGPQLGPDHSFADLSSGLHLLFAMDMLLGRLEILPVLLCLHPLFWRH